MFIKLHIIIFILTESVDSNSYQRKFWTGKFGQEYIKRNQTLDKVNESYRKQTGITVQQIFEDFFDPLDRSSKILELGCNVGINFEILKKMGFSNLTGVEINTEAISIAKHNHPNLNFINSSIEEFNSNQKYDLVYTAGVLIHINPNSLNSIISKIVSLSKKYIFGFEYFSETLTEIQYRENNFTCWKQDFPNLYLWLFPELRINKLKKFEYVDNGLQDVAYLLEKI
jgi:pseudaminic acid biosynthesis-associated methylase